MPFIKKENIHIISREENNYAHPSIIKCEFLQKILNKNNIQMLYFNSAYKPDREQNHLLLVFLIKGLMMVNNFIMTSNLLMKLFNFSFFPSFQ